MASKNKIHADIDLDGLVQRKDSLEYNQNQNDGDDGISNNEDEGEFQEDYENSDEEYDDDDDEDEDEGQQNNEQLSKNQEEMNDMEKELEKLKKKGDPAYDQQEDDHYDQEEDNDIDPEELRRNLVELVKRCTAADAILYLTGYINSAKDNHPEIYQLRADAYMKQRKYIEALHDVEQANILDQQIQCSKSCKQHYSITKSLMRMSNDF